jgi:hypothetical protein
MRKLRPSVTVIALALGFWICWLASSVQPANATPSGSPAAQGVHRTPQEAAPAFYRWYLTELANHRDPLSQDRGKIESYVTKTLLQEIDRRINSPDGLDEDYFIRAQDYLDDWMKEIVVSDVRIQGQNASEIVTLGATKESRHRLALKLVNEGGSWKISKVGSPPVHLRDYK